MAELPEPLGFNLPTQDSLGRVQGIGMEPECTKKRVQVFLSTYRFYIWSDPNLIGSQL